MEEKTVQKHYLNLRWFLNWALRLQGDAPLHRHCRESQGRTDGYFREWAEKINCSVERKINLLPLWNCTHISAASATRENTEVEFKNAKGGFPCSLLETYSAFANTNGGIIVLGIAEKDHRFFPDGLDKETVTKYKKLFWDGANNKNTVNVCIVSDSDVFEAEYKGNYVLIVKVPRVEYNMRPIYRKPPIKDDLFF